MSQVVMGVETEYAVTGPPGRPEAVLGLILLAQERFACVRGPALADMFLGNGSRIYLDCGEHPEVATPECSNPSDVVRYIAAGERVLERLCSHYREQDPSQSVIDLYKSNVDYGGALTTWGCHESYLCRRPPRDFIPDLVPHLVSRIIYTGAGGFNPLSPGLRPALSPRVYHLSAVVADGSTDRRGIFHTKDESLARRRYHRLHLICGESLHSHIAAYLKCGVTALVIALIDHGDAPGAAVRLVDPLVAMRAIAEDETCRRPVALAGGRQVSAVEIQRHYLSAVQARLGAPWLPAWAAEVCREWSAMLDRLQQAPAAVQTRLDWAIKLALFKAHAARQGLAWDKLPVFSAVAEAMGGDARPPDLGLTRTGFRHFQRLRAELCEIDLRCARLGPTGILAALDAAGVLDHGAPGVGDIEQAVHDAPADTRAHARAAAIRAAPPRCDWWCTWERIEDLGERRILPLEDPFAASAEWTPLPSGGPGRDPAPAESARLLHEMEFSRMLQRLHGREVVTRARSAASRP